MSSPCLPLRDLKNNVKTDAKAIALVAGRASDCAFYAALEQQDDVKPFLFPYTRVEHLAERCKPGVLYLNIVDAHNQALLGFIGLVVDQEGGTPTVIECRRMALAVRNSGVGSQALRLLDSFIIEHYGAAHVWLDVLPNNCRAIGAYQAAGFHFSHSALSFAGDVFIFQKQLHLEASAPKASRCLEV